jgi:hypothetical protein
LTRAWSRVVGGDQAVAPGRSSGGVDSVDGAGIHARGAVDTGSGIDHPDIALLADSVGRAGRVTGAAVDAFAIDGISHGYSPPSSQIGKVGNR